MATAAATMSGQDRPALLSGVSSIDLRNCEGKGVHAAQTQKQPPNALKFVRISEDRLLQLVGRSGARSLALGIL